jgi:hypothetical protein
MSEAKHNSAKAVQEQKDKDTKIQAERVSRLCDQKERLEQEYNSLFRQNVGLEQRMETLRSRNRQLEVQQRKQRAADEEQEAKLEPQLRKQAHQLRVLTDLLRLPPDTSSTSLASFIGASGREDRLGESGGLSTAASNDSVSASTWPSTSASQRLVNSNVSLVPTRSTGALSEPGVGTSQVRKSDPDDGMEHSLSDLRGKYEDANDDRDILEYRQASDGFTSPSLSQVAASAMGDLNRLGTGNFVENGVPYGVGSDSPAIPRHLEAAISRTQDLINEVQGWGEIEGYEEMLPELPEDNSPSYSIPERPE